MQSKHREQDSLGEILRERKLIQEASLGALFPLTPDTPTGLHHPLLQSSVLLPPLLNFQDLLPPAKLEINDSQQVCDEGSRADICQQYGHLQRKEGLRTVFRTTQWKIGAVSQETFP